MGFTTTSFTKLSTYAISRIEYGKKPNFGPNFSLFGHIFGSLIFCAFFYFC